MSDNQTPKPTTVFSSGIMIGGGAAMLSAGLLIAFALNNLYNQQTSYLIDQGIQISNYAFGFDDLVFLISTGALISMLGVYMLVLGCLNNFSATARAMYSLKDGLARVGNGLITGGFILASLFTANLIRQLYQSYHSTWYPPY